jgi:hypothetical protein
MGAQGQSLHRNPLSRQQAQSSRCRHNNKPHWLGVLHWQNERELQLVLSAFFRGAPQLARLDQFGVDVALVGFRQWLLLSAHLRWLLGIAIAMGSPQVAPFLVAASRTSQPDFAFRRVRLRQFGRHWPRAALGAFFKQGIGFDHHVSLVTRVFTSDQRTAGPGF